jgi:Phage capsid family
MDVVYAASRASSASSALVGNFGTAATLYRRGGLTVEATNSHSDYFKKNLVAVRAEQREALAVYYPNAFTVVSGLSYTLDSLHLLGETRASGSSVASKGSTQPASRPLTPSEGFT